MNVLVTGASGFVGRCLVETLACHVHQGIATGRALVSGMPPRWQSVARAELLNMHGQRRVVDAVVHLEVKQHITRPTAADTKQFRAVNEGGTREWLAWATAHAVQRVIFVSSVKAVSNLGGIADETAPAETNDPYGASKAEAEKAVRQWADASPARCAVILRFVPVYGPGNQANLASFAKQIVRGRPCLVGDGRARKSLLSRLNAVAAIEHVLAHAQQGCTVFNVADKDPLTIREIAENIAAACHAPAPRTVPWFAAACLAAVGNAVERVIGREFVLDSRRLNTLTTDAVYPADKLFRTGFIPVQATREGIAEMARWVRAGS